ncbi:MAG: hypothetical protein L3J08_09325 [Flavobacteriaceae bacterium]|nr:hypothetical protein [Flavobacteriaceae bacterium]
MHLKTIPSFLMIFICATIFAQEATEIYLFDLNKVEGTYYLNNPINISNNEGYDNQPCFTNDGSAILFTSTRNGQTDIARYNLKNNYRNWITNTEVNEYSPAPYMGKKKYFTCVRFDNNEPILYKYSYRKKEPQVLIPNLKVVYYVWFNKNIVITYVLGDVESLQVSNFRYKIKYPIEQNIGRSLNKIPNPLSIGNDKISYISKNHEISEINAINPLTSDSEYIADALEGSEDLTWTIDGAILMGKEDQIYILYPKKDKDWKPIYIESEAPIEGITRMTVSPDGKKIAIVVKEQIAKN